MHLFLQLCVFFYKYLYMKFYAYQGIYCHELVHTTERHGYMTTTEEAKTEMSTTMASKTKTELTSSEHSTDRNHLILFLSGLLSCHLESYIRQTLHDLQKMQVDNEMLAKYKLLVYQNDVKTSLEVADDIIAFLTRYHDRTPGGIQKIVLVGFSAGGILASHVMNGLDFLPVSCSKHIVTYDTPLSMQHIMHQFSKNRVLRLDCLYFYAVVLFIYWGHWRQQEIYRVIDRWAPPLMGGFRWYIGVDKTVAMLCEIHGLTVDQFQFKTTFLYEQPANTQITHLCCKDDPILDHAFNANYTAQSLQKIQVGGGCRIPVKHVVKDSIDQCTDMYRGKPTVASYLVEHIV
jgi:hypothetical protein